MGIESLGLSRALAVGPWAQRSQQGWHEGLLAGCPVVLAHCGVGVRAAQRCTEALLRAYEPRLVLLTGAAGGVAPQVDLGDLVLAEAVYQLDSRRLALFHRNPRAHASHGRADFCEKLVAARYPCDPGYLALAWRAAEVAPLRPVRSRPPKVLEAGVATAGGVVRNRRCGEQMAREHGILATDMEGAAVAHVCAMHGIPFLSIRSISDLIGRHWQWLTMIRYLVPAQRNAERLVFSLVQLLSQDAFVG